MGRTGGIAQDGERKKFLSPLEEIYLYYAD